MPNSTNHPSLNGHRVDASTLALTSSSLDPKKEHPNDSHDAVDAPFLLNSASTIPSQTQLMPVLGQVVSHHQMDETTTRRSNLTLSFGHHPNSTSNSYPVQFVNINIIQGSNSFVNVNLLNSQPPSQFTRNDLLESSSNPLPITNNNYISASSHFQQPFQNLNSNQSPILDRISETNQSLEFTGYLAQYVSPTVPTVSGTRPNTIDVEYEKNIPTAIPISMTHPRPGPANLYPHQWQSSHPHHRVPSQNHTFSQRASSLNFNQPSLYFPGENHNHIPGFESLTLNQSKHQVLTPDGGNGTFPENSHSRPNHSTSPESHPATEQVTDQVLELKYNGTPLPQTELIQEPPQMHSQNGNRNETSELDPQDRRHPSIMRHAPYTCPKCSVTFTSGTRLAAHMNLHYKDETPAERKKRRERKYLMQDLCITQSHDGIITVMPRSYQQQGETSAAANITEKRGNASNQGVRTGPKIIKEEK
ncbi:uncharacterized protein LOC130817397 [Amaranthus tricolor]|uniref:uncharacterized protein LOC130817397 n=1 Tax=Amaranthus tricolor TaxID=29722 RepID=UPI00258648CC|nr:uncharacterized protein LOC130817397 [Amaranthus tricolor]